MGWWFPSPLIIGICFMKISKLFHWLYFIVMMLPIMVAPIFAIYSHRHTIDTYSVERSEPLQVNASQYIINGQPSSLDNISSDGDVSLSFSNNTFVASFLREPNEYGEVYFDLDYTFVDNHKVFCYFDAYVNQNQLSNPLTPYLTGDGEFYGTNLVLTLQQTTYYFILSNNDGENYSLSYFAFGYDNGIDNDFDLFISNVMLFDLTEIFGSGNEPTADVFNTYLVQDYYEYGVNTLTIGNHNVIFQDSDIGSQFVYDLYNCVDKYFNYDKVFNFGDLYGWLQLTFFSGNAPLGFFIFWHLLIY